MSRSVRRMGGWERFGWFVGAGLVVIALSYAVDAMFDLDAGGEFAARIGIVVVVGLVVAPIFRRRNGYRD